jgi:hypothetical protein
MSRNIEPPKGYDEQGNFSPLLAMQALSEAYDQIRAENRELYKRVNVLRYAYSEQLQKNDKLFTELCDALEQMSEMAIDLKYEMALNHEV